MQEGTAEASDEGHFRQAVEELKRSQGLDCQMEDRVKTSKTRRLAEKD